MKCGVGESFIYPNMIIRYQKLNNSIFLSSSWFISFLRYQRTGLFINNYTFSFLSNLRKASASQVF